ncbi:hypothetical protein [Streptococcus salivarius]|uniref:hypothetical protein n=1 Tax=Streptococcus salivarius TaxID=1304 RepID=UPI001020B163|nr:hypothetical protein [Streptococcus salivarius]MTR04442.1 hypothetical protein [Streptococcus salivarius]MTR52959.1 hypothetical protein [Streptococcus salivarius]RYS61974.1 hypothetical protein EAI94_09530 [Streptococcus salivarius]
MSVFNQNNNNYGDGFQINTQNQYQSSQDNDLTKLPGTIATTMNMSSDVEKIISVIDRIKNTLSNLWK